MYLKQTLGISLIAFYCTLIPMASNGQAYYRNDRLEQRHPHRYTPHRGHVYHNDSRHITMIEMVIDIEMIDTNRDGLNIVEMSVIAMIITGTDDIDTIVFSELS